MTEKLPMDKSLEEIFGNGFKNCYASDIGSNIGFVINKLVSSGIKISAVIYTVEKMSDHPLRDGIFLYTCGKIVDWGYDVVLYLRDMHQQQINLAGKIPQSHDNM